MRIWLAGAAAVALAASGAYAQPGKGNGNNGNGKGQAAAKVEHGKPDRGPQRSGNSNGNGIGNKAARPEVRVEKRAAPQSNNNARKDVVRQPQRKAERQVERRIDDRRQAVRQPERRIERRDDRRYTGRDDRNGARYVDRVRYDRDRTFLLRDRDRGLISGCPPGLAKKYNGCMPPGQVKERYETYNYWNGYNYRPSLFGLLNYGSGRYYYDNGYLLRPASNGGIAGYIPLLGGALAIGNPWPASYSSYAVPEYYVDYYDLGPASSYRYADNVIYRVDPGDTAIMSVAALLTGDDFTIGQPMPMGYDVYNVPYAYRDRYYDTPDAWYRYSDGYVYQVDPETQLIAAAIDLLI